MVTFIFLGIIIVMGKLESALMALLSVAHSLLDAEKEFTLDPRAVVTKPLANVHLLLKQLCKIVT